MLIDLIAVAITLFFILGSAYLGAMRSLVKIASFFGSAILSLLLFPWMQKSALYHVGVQWMERQLAAKGLTLFTDQAAGVLCSFLLAILLYLCSKLVLFLLSTFLEGIVRLPVLKQVNRLTGAILGFAEAVLLICAALAILHFMAASSGDLPIYGALRQAPITGWLYEQNPLLLLFRGTVGK